MTKKIFGLMVIAGVLLFSAQAWAACYEDCMSRYGCWNSMGESENRSFCSGTQATCTTECRNQGKNEKSYGAIAYNKKDGSFGYSEKLPNQGKAEKTALKYCNKYKTKGKCEVMVWYYNSCGSIAADGKKTGWAHADSSAEAAAKALTMCKKKGGKKCQTIATQCSR